MTQTGLLSGCSILTTLLGGLGYLKEDLLSRAQKQSPEEHNPTKHRTGPRSQTVRIVMPGRRVWVSHLGELPLLNTMISKAEGVPASGHEG